MSRRKFYRSAQVNDLPDTDQVVPEKAMWRDVEGAHIGGGRAVEWTSSTRGHMAQVENKHGTYKAVYVEVKKEDE